MERSAEPETGPVTLAEPDLVSLARTGDQLAWRRLVRAHQQSVFRLTLLITRNIEDAEDMSQETFVKAFRHLDRYDSEREFRPWLLTIAGRLARNRSRGMGRYLKMLTARRSIPTVDNWVETGNAVQAGQLLKAIQHLSPNARYVIYLRYFAGLTEAETAETLGIRPGTVKSRSARALGKLATIIRTHFPELQPERETNG